MRLNRGERWALLRKPLKQMYRGRSVIHAAWGWLSGWVHRQSFGRWCATTRARLGLRRNGQTIAKLRSRSVTRPSLRCAYAFGTARTPGVDTEQIDHKLFALLLRVFRKMLLYRRGPSCRLVLIILRLSRALSRPHRPQRGASRRFHVSQYPPLPGGPTIGQSSDGWKTLPIVLSMRLIDCMTNSWPSNH